MDTGRVYGTPNLVQIMYEQVTRAAPDLLGRLRALAQLGHVSADTDAIEAVRAALFRAHGRH